MITYGIFFQNNELKNHIIRITRLICFICEECFVFHCGKQFDVGMHYEHPTRLLG